MYQHTTLRHNGKVLCKCSFRSSALQQLKVENVIYLAGSDNQ